MRRVADDLRRRARGQAVVEYAIAFPVLLLLTLAVVQLAHIFVAKHVVSLASFHAARAALVDEDYERAADMTCSLIAGPGGVGTGTTITLPGWGPLRGSAASEAKTTAVIRDDVQTDYPATTVEVRHQFELRIPVADVLAYELGDVLLGIEGLDEGTYGTPHLEIRSRTTLSRPWSDQGMSP